MVVIFNKVLSCTLMVEENQGSTALMLLQFRGYTVYFYIILILRNYKNYQLTTTSTSLNLLANSCEEHVSHSKVTKSMHHNQQLRGARIRFTSSEEPASYSTVSRSVHRIIV